MILVGICLVMQVLAFVSTWWKRILLRKVFPKQTKQALALAEEEDGSKQIRVREQVHSNKVFEEIIKTINRYLQNNKGSADYAILKDITDRNCDAVEAQIEATSPLPVYIGLAGTLIGIIIGVGVLAFQGGVDSLLDTESAVQVESVDAAPRSLCVDGKKIVDANGEIHVYSADEQEWKEYTDKGAEGIKNLLQGVGIAMLTTLFGVGFTIIGAWSSKRSSKINEEKKNGFLSWLQSELLPQMSDDLGQVIFQMQRNLTK